MTRDEKARIAREQSRRIASDRDLRLRVVEADFGRDLIWEAELEGIPVALLSSPKLEAEHWTSFAITPATTDVGQLQALQTAGFWLHPNLIFRNRELGLIATHAIAAGEGPSNGRISIKALKFDIALSISDRVYRLWRILRPTGKPQ